MRYATVWSHISAERNRSGSAIMNSQGFIYGVHAADWLIENAGPSFAHRPNFDLV